MKSAGSCAHHQAAKDDSLEVSQQPALEPAPPARHAAGFTWRSVRARKELTTSGRPESGSVGKAQRVAKCDTSGSNRLRFLPTFSSTAGPLPLFFVLGLLTVAQLAQAGFWTFYLPNNLKPAGYKEMSTSLKRIQADINATRDAFADHQYFWSQLEGFGGQSDEQSIDEQKAYPEQSVCTELFPLFTRLAKEYSDIDFEHVITPLEKHYQSLVDLRDLWYPDGKKSKTILPREWEQKLIEQELRFKLDSYEKLTFDTSHMAKRKQMVDIWTAAKRGLDQSPDCLYLRYACGQVAKDINQMGLEMNVEAIKQALRMVQSAYPMIEKFKLADELAIRDIEEDMEEQSKFNVEI